MSIHDDDFMIITTDASADAPLESIQTLCFRLHDRYYVQRADSRWPSSGLLLDELQRRYAISRRFVETASRTAKAGSSGVGATI